MDRWWARRLRAFAHPTPLRRRARIIRVHPVHSLGRQRQQQFQHAVADPGAGSAELALAVAVAAGERDDRSRRGGGVRPRNSGRLHQAPAGPASAGRAAWRLRAPARRPGRHADWWRARRRRSDSVRWRDQVGSVATSSVAVTTIFSAASRIRGIGSCQPAWKSSKCRLIASWLMARNVAASVPCEGCVLHHITPSFSSELQKP